MHFRQVLHEEKGCISYFMGCPSQAACAVIDPQGDPQWYLDQVENNGMVIKWVFETHLHADHLSCAKAISDLTDSPLYVGPGAKVSFDKYEELEDGQELMIGRWKMKVLHTPGHTLEHVCLNIEDWFLLTGDSLFVGDVGRVDLTPDRLTEGQIEQRAAMLYHSIQKMLNLPEWMEIYPGHYRGSVCGRGLDDKAVSTLGREIRNNPTLKFTEKEFVEFQLKNIPPLPDNWLELKRQNSGQAVLV